MVQGSQLKVLILWFGCKRVSDGDALALKLEGYNLDLAN